MQDDTVIVSNIRLLMELMCYMPALLCPTHAKMETSHSGTATVIVGHIEHSSCFLPCGPETIQNPRKRMGNHSLFKYLMAGRTPGPFPNTTLHV